MLADDGDPVFRVDRFVNNEILFSISKTSTESRSFFFVWSTIVLAGLPSKGFFLHSDELKLLNFNIILI